MFCFAAVSAAAFFTFWIEALRTNAPFTLFYAVVALCTWVSGTRAGLTAMGASFVAGWYFIQPPVCSFAADLNATICLAAMGFTMLVIWGALAGQHAADQDGRTAGEWTRRTMEFMSDGVIATDEKGTVRFMNARAAELTGWPTAEATERPLWEVFRLCDERTGAPLESTLAQSLRDGSTAPARRCLVQRRDGTSVVIEEHAAAIAPLGKIDGAVLVFREVAKATD
ncbi:MAG: PAS domain-containing protein [Chthoniobacteraceae bacterium]